MITSSTISTLVTMIAAVYSDVIVVTGFIPSTGISTSVGGSATISSRSQRSFQEAQRCQQSVQGRRYPQITSKIYNTIEDEDDYDEDEDDDYIDSEVLGDWRNFRRNLAMQQQQEQGASNSEASASALSVAADEDDNYNDDDDSVGNQSKNVSSSSPSSVSTTASTVQANNNLKRAVSKENEDLLKSQNEVLHHEYMTGVWAHETSTPEVGGLVARMPLEMELYRNFKHSVMGRRLRQKLDDGTDTNDATDATEGSGVEMGIWYARAKQLIEDGMTKIASKADEGGQIDATTLGDESTELLSLYLDNQETWQEVCLVLEQSAGNAKTLVLNRPMAFKLTENLGKLVLQGAFSPAESSDMKLVDRRDLMRFMMAFSSECAVYVGGPNNQGEAATMIHGIPDLPGAKEISPGAKIYSGGIDAAVEGVLEGKYNPLEFRFFVGCHEYKESALDVAVHLGKYQPIACARSVALKQCISLPKPLWHEVLELCGGDMNDLSTLELMKRDDLQFQVVDESEYDSEDEEDDL